MTSFELFYVQCPCCGAWLTGKKAKAETINQSVLYSDGMVISDLFPVNPQKLVCCPGCSHAFWLEPHHEHPKVEGINDMGPYAWGSWRFFGANLDENRGRMALIRHYLRILDQLKPFAPEQEIYLRYALLWAYNDLYRHSKEGAVGRLIRSHSSMRVRLSQYLFHREGIRLFLAHQNGFIRNINRLIALLEQNPPDDLVQLVELYREAGEFQKAKDLLKSVPRRTHYINRLMACIKESDKKVFRVAG